MQLRKRLLVAEAGSSSLACGGSGTGWVAPKYDE
jgi:hypothetical protein